MKTERKIIIIEIRNRLSIVCTKFLTRFLLLLLLLVLLCVHSITLLSLSLCFSSALCGNNWLNVSKKVAAIKNITRQILLLLSEEGKSDSRFFARKTNKFKPN